MSRLRAKRFALLLLLLGRDPDQCSEAERFAGRSHKEALIFP
jgi:hypothetical protein